MEQKAYLAMTAMLNSFPQGAANPDLTMGTYEAVLASVSSQAIVDAAMRYTCGDVPDQSKTFAPSVAEFVQEARKQQEVIDIRARPRIAAPEYRPGPLAPFQIRRQAKLTEYRDHPVLHENIGHDEWRKLSRAKAVPVGAVWVASLQIVYGPKNNA